VFQINVLDQNDSVIDFEAAPTQLRTSALSAIPPWNERSFLRFSMAKLPYRSGPD